MPIWREPRNDFSVAKPRGNYLAKIALLGSASEPVHITYMRNTDGKIGKFGWRPNPENSVVLDLPEFADAPNRKAGEALAEQVLAELQAGELHPAESAYVLPPKPQYVLGLRHDTKLIAAAILKRTDHYEIRTAAYMPNGWVMPISSPSISQDPDNDWGWVDLLEKLLADSEEEAIEAAHESIKKVAESDQPVRTLAEMRERFPDAFPYPFLIGRPAE